MPIATACPHCKARYRVPDAAAGKRTKCKKCGDAFRIPQRASAAAKPRPAPATAARSKRKRSPRPEPTPVAPSPADSGLSLDDLGALAGGEAVAGLQDSDLENDGTSYTTEDAAAAVPQPPRGPAGPLTASRGRGALVYAKYVAAVAQGAAFLKNPSNIVKFMIVWILLAAREVMLTAWSVSMGLFIPFVGVGILIITGWYLAFQMNVVASAAGEEDEIPGVVAENDFWDGVLIPMLQMLATYVFALLPVLIYLTILTRRLIRAAIDSPSNAMIPVPGMESIIVLIVLAAAGMLIWPMAVLIVSCGSSIAALFRLDLIGASIIKSLPAYLLAVVAVYVTFGARIGVTIVAMTQADENTNWQDDWMALFLLPAVFAGITLFFDIAALRAIGYYYSHFKNRLAWSWG